MDENKETEEYDAEYYERKNRHVNDKSKLAWALVGAAIIPLFLLLFAYIIFLFMASFF